MVWLQRDDRSYWPSAVKGLPCPATCLCFTPGDEQHLYVGMAKGAITVRAQ